MLAIYIPAMLSPKQGFIMYRYLLLYMQAWKHTHARTNHNITGAIFALAHIRTRSRTYFIAYRAHPTGRRGSFIERTHVSICPAFAHKYADKC